MSHEANVHPAQVSILRELLFRPEAGFAELQKPTGLESDHFKFHMRRLVELGYVEKTEAGTYRLTVSGKEYSNKLDTDKNAIERQPKTAVILMIERAEGLGEFLLQERLKHPYFGFWGFPGGKIRWGETIMQAAARELYEESGLSATLTYRGVYHEHVTEKDSGELLEDKIFHVVSGIVSDGELIGQFDGGRNAWVTLEQARAKDKVYASFDIEARVGLGEVGFIEKTQSYSSKGQF